MQCVWNASWVIKAVGTECITPGLQGIDQDMPQSHTTDQPMAPRG